VNALFYDPTTNQIIDVVDGLADLENKILRVVGEPEKRFDEDKLRLLRAVRFAGQLDFEIEKATADAVKTFAKGLVRVSRERIRDEIDKLLMAKNPARGFLELDRLGLAIPVFDDWSNWIFPVDSKVFEVSSLEVRRALLFYPALNRTSPDRSLERLKAWKYGRAFCDLIAWIVKNETSLRATCPDPLQSSGRAPKSRSDILREFEIGGDDDRLYSINERDWMTSLELWTDGRAERACAILDALKGIDPHRFDALTRRGLTLGKEDPLKAKASDLQAKPEGKAVEGARLGRELRRLNREILKR
jgi:hypothetical protein